MGRAIILSVFLALSILRSSAGLIPRLSGDPDFVTLGKNRGYYMISSDTGRWWQWGLARAPVREPQMFTHGYGADVIAIPFDTHGQVTFAPVYIYTIRPQNAERQRLEALIQGATSQEDVRQIFGRPAIQGHVRGYQVWYYQIEVYNPFEEFPDDPS